MRRTQSRGRTVLGAAPYGAYRADIAAAFGARFGNASFTMSASHLAAGTYTVVAYALSTVTSAWTAQSAAVTIPMPTALVGIDAPAANAVITSQPFVIGGWAIDLTNPTAAGVEALHIYAYPHAGGAPILIGVVGITGQRPDVAAIYGARYLVSGYGKSATLPSGTYTLVFYPLMTTGTFDYAHPGTRVVTIQ